MRRFIFILDCTEQIAQTPGNLPQKWTYFFKNAKFRSGKEFIFQVNVREDSSLFLTALSTLLRHLEICLKNGPIFCQKVPNSEVAKNSFFRSMYEKILIFILDCTLLRHLDICLKKGALFRQKVPKGQSIHFLGQCHLFFFGCTLLRQYIFRSELDCTLKLLIHLDICLKSIQNHGPDYLQMV